MKIELLKLTENEDGSADVDLELDDEAKKLLIQVGIETLLLRVIKNYEEKSNES
jgi:hypothetical protein